MPMQPATLVGGQIIKAHDPKVCADDKFCCVHKPSDHNMSAFPQNWREDRKMMERICSHGIGHPDPDHIKFVESALGKVEANLESIHGCDGCCESPNGKFLL